MASSHTHTIKLDDGKLYHLFNLQFLTVDEIEVLQHAINNNPIPQELVHIHEDLKNCIANAIVNAQNMEVEQEKAPKGD